MLPPAHILVNSLILFPFARKKPRKRFAYIAFGSILPDLIDKPLGFLLYHSFGNGRLIAHTLLFNLLLLLLCVYLGKELWLIGICSMLHLVEDQMWRMPDVLFFPFLGPIRKRPSMDLGRRIESVFAHLHNPAYLALNVAGCIFLSVLIYICIKSES